MPEKSFPLFFMALKMKCNWCLFLRVEIFIFIVLIDILTA